MSTDYTDVARSRKSCRSESSGAVTNASLSQPNTSQAPLGIHSSIMNLLNMALSPDKLQSYYNKLDFLKKSSFYIMIEVQDDPRPLRRDYISNSTLWRYIDQSKFERVKNDGISQVKLQLQLLEMLHSELTRGRKELENILAQGGVALELGEAKIQQEILRLQQAAEYFVETLVPGKLPVKHKMIPELINKGLPEFELFLKAQRPVMFNRVESRSFCNSVVLHWYILDQETRKTEEKFEVSFKLVNPTSEMEAREFGCRTCSGLVFRLSKLTPNRSYSFSVKRVDNVSLIYRNWKDTMVLSTTTRRTRVRL